MGQGKLLVLGKLGGRARGMRDEGGAGGLRPGDRELAAFLRTDGRRQGWKGDGQAQGAGWSQLPESPWMESAEVWPPASPSAPPAGAGPSVSALNRLGGDGEAERVKDQY